MYFFFISVFKCTMILIFKGLWVFLLNGVFFLLCLWGWFTGFMIIIIKGRLFSQRLDVVLFKFFWFVLMFFICSTVAEQFLDIKLIIMLFFMFFYF